MVLGARAMAVLAVVAAMSAAACDDPSQALCETLCDCAGCSPTDLDVCVAGLSYEADLADAFGCTTYFDGFRDCYADAATCDQGTVRFTPADACVGDEVSYEACMAGLRTDWSLADLPGLTTPDAACRRAERKVSATLAACGIEAGGADFACDAFSSCGPVWTAFFSCAADAVVCTGDPAQPIDTSGVDGCGIPAPCDAALP